MKTLDMPGFTAEASLRSNADTYSRHRWSQSPASMNRIVPQETFCDFWAWKCTRPPRNFDYESPGWYQCMANVGCRVG
jgi:hypothetical protein